MIKHRNDNLTKDEELELGRKIQAMRKIKDSVEDYDFYKLSKEDADVVMKGEDALEVLTGNYINFARDIAHKHYKRTGTRYGIDDLLQDAISALIESANNYDPKENCRLGTYAFYGITKKVSTTINYQRLVRMPENKMGEYILISRAQRAYNDLPKEEQNKYKNELEYVYENVGDLKKKEVDLILENMQPQVSLNANIYDGDGELMDVLVDENSEIEIKSIDALDKNVERIISELTPFQRDLIAFEYEAFPASMSYKEFLEKYDVTDKKAKHETRKVVTVMANIAKKYNLKATI